MSVFRVQLEKERQFATFRCLFYRVCASVGACFGRLIIAHVSANEGEEFMATERGMARIHFEERVV